MLLGVNCPRILKILHNNVMRDESDVAAFSCFVFDPQLFVTGVHDETLNSSSHPIYSYVQFSRFVIYIFVIFLK